MSLFTCHLGHFFMSLLPLFSLLFLSCVPDVRIFLKNSFNFLKKPSLSPPYPVLYWKCFAKWTSSLSFIFYLYLYLYILSLNLIFCKTLCLPLTESFIGIFLPNKPLVSLLSFIFYTHLLSFSKLSLSPSYPDL